MKTPRFTVFTPTYNRRHLIDRPAKSLASQSYRDFEWIVYDDGSSDGTEEYIASLSQYSSFPIRYYRSENNGKARAINAGLDLALGEWFIVLDSDDWCDAVALERINREVNLIQERDDYDQYGAISVLKRYSSGAIVGSDYGSLEKYGMSYLDRHSSGVSGDKWEVIRTDVHRKFRYDLVEGDRYMAPGYAWLRLASRYKTVFVNEALSTIEYQSDGISLNNIKHRLSSKRTTLKYYRFAESVAKSRLVKFRLSANAARFAMHCDEAAGVGPFATVVGRALFYRDRALGASR